MLKETVQLLCWTAHSLLVLANNAVVSSQHIVNWFLRAKKTHKDIHAEKPLQTSQNLLF